MHRALMQLMKYIGTLSRVYVFSVESSFNVVEECRIAGTTCAIPMSTQFSHGVWASSPWLF